MNESIHGHEVIHMMMESSSGFSTASLRKAIDQRFGPEARFHTCSAENLTADQLIAFLAERGKFVPTEAGFGIDPAKVCNHDHDHQD